MIPMDDDNGERKDETELNSTIININNNHDDDDDGSGNMEVVDNCKLYFPSDNQHDMSWYDMYDML